MKKFKVAQYLSNYSDIEFAQAGKATPLVNLKQTIHYQVVTVTAENEIEAIAHVHEQSLLPTIPDQVVQLIKRLWNAENIHHLYFVTTNIDCIMAVVVTLPDFIRYTLDSVASDIIDEIEDAKMQ